MQHPPSTRDPRPHHDPVPFVSSRRALLTGLPALALGAGVAFTAEAEMSTGQRSDPRAPEYRETPHIRTFYALARR